MGAKHNKINNFLFLFLMILFLISVFNIKTNAFKDIEGNHVQIPLGGNTYYTDGYLAIRPYGFHPGIDLVKDTRANTINAPVYPAKECVVLAVNKITKNRKELNLGDDNDRESDIGNTVIVYHLDGSTTSYVHLNIVNVQVGQTVDKNDQIGTVGNTRRGKHDPTMGPHVHYELRKLLDAIENTYQATHSSERKVSWGLDPCGGTAENPGDPAKENVKHRESGEEDGEEDDSMDGEDGDGEEDGVTGTNPGGERPDDNESFATSSPSYNFPDSKSRFYRLAPKKGKTNILLHWNYEKLLEERGQYFESVGTGGTPDEAYLVNLNTRINEAYNLLSKNSLQYSKERSETPDLVILRHGYFGSASSLIGLYKEAWRRVIPSFSPLWVKENPVMVIPTGGLYGMENSEQFKSTLADYVSQGGTLIVFAQQHGYEYTLLPTPDEKPLECYGWREDQSCHTNSIFVDTWHPAFSSVTESLVSSAVDGFFSDYPSSSTVLLRRRVNGMPAMLTYPYGDGRVVVTSMYEDWGTTHWQSSYEGRAIVRDLVAWAKNPDLEIPEYDLRDNPNPEVVLNLEVKNLSGKNASNVKILWLDPDRDLYFEEETMISFPDAGNKYS